MSALILAAIFIKFGAILAHEFNNENEQDSFNCFLKFRAENGLCYGTFEDTFHDHETCCKNGEGYSDSLVRVKGKGYFCTPCPKPVNGQWGEWQQWAPCSATCGKGLWVRKRFCNNPSPALGGNPCPPEDGRQVEECFIEECPVDGKWSQWGSFSPCSTTCGSGIRVRRRKCDDPAPKFRGEPCFGEFENAIECYMGPCPIDGGWSLWSHWSQCSATCGGGIQQRFRICNNPSPQFNGAECEGNKGDVAECRAEIECPVHGHWSAWSTWGKCLSPDCSTNQDTGFQYRYRMCDNPKPQHNGRMCQETFIDAGTCFDPINCPSDGQWGRWSEWECVGSEMRRTRKCDSPPPRFGGKNCNIDDSVEEISRRDDPESFSAVCGDEKNSDENEEGSGVGVGVWKDADD